ncbi:MAG: hypothetical protein KDC67_15815 [Ignavibacteriae bacterium]|nr:hypothetical protein [Ignavibacteriota bacterium]
MRYLFSVILIFNFDVYAIDGLQFSECFRRAINDSIDTFKEEELRNSQNLDVEGTRICNQLSEENYQNIKKLFVEYDVSTKNEKPYESEDMNKIKIAELSSYLIPYIDCYKNYSEKENFIGNIVNKISTKRNKNLLESAISLIKKKKSPKDSLKSLGDIDLVYCKF